MANYIDYFIPDPVTGELRHGKQYTGLKLSNDDRSPGITGGRRVGRRVAQRGGSVPWEELSPLERKMIDDMIASGFLKPSARNNISRRGDSVNPISAAFDLASAVDKTVRRHGDAMNGVVEGMIEAVANPGPKSGYALIKNLGNLADHVIGNKGSGKRRKPAARKPRAKKAAARKPAARKPRRGGNKQFPSVDGNYSIMPINKNLPKFAVI